MKNTNSQPHIGIFGRRNSGKSSLINFITGQETSIVADVAGTTTDPVKKSVEITGLGPVVMIDTAGIDDVGELGQKRIVKTIESIKKVDLAILVITHHFIGDDEKRLIAEFKQNDLPYYVVYNKTDIFPLTNESEAQLRADIKGDFFALSTFNLNLKDRFIDELKKRIPESAYSKPSMLGGLVNYGDIVLLITPIDIEAPAGRLILPQVQAIRDVLDNDCVAIVLKEREVDSFLKRTGIKPALVVTDSQVFLKADASIPRDIPLTSFSILLAKLKGDFEHYLQGTPKIADLKDGDRVLLLESCTHHTSCDDIGRVKIPRWLTQFTGKKLSFEIVAGLDSLPAEMEDYSLVIQCGGCMITWKQIQNRLRRAIDAGVPVTNYGMAIAYTQGIYARAVEPFSVGGLGQENYL